MPPYWWIPVGMVGLLLLFCAGMALYCSVLGRVADWELDAMERRISRVRACVEAVQQHLDEHTGVDLDEVELYAHADYDRYRFGYRLPGEAAEVDKEHKR